MLPNWHIKLVNREIWTFFQLYNFLEQPNCAYSAFAQIRKVLLWGSQPSGHMASPSDCASGHIWKGVISSGQTQPWARAQNLVGKTQAEYQSSSAPSVSCPYAMNYLPSHMRWACQPETTICSNGGLNHQSRSLWRKTYLRPKASFKSLPLPSL